MEIVFRATFVFFFLWLVTRAVGRSTLGELSSFQLLLYIMMGDLIQQGVTQQDYSVTGSVLAVGTIALLTIMIGWVALRWPRSRRLIHDVPVVIVRRGEALAATMKTEGMTDSDLREAARQQGFRDIADIDLAVLEVNGRISFFTREEEGESGSPSGPSTG